MTRKKHDEPKPEKQNALPEAETPTEVAEAEPEQEEVPAPAPTFEFGNYNRALEEENLRNRLHEAEEKLRATEQHVAFLDRLGVKLFGLTPAEQAFHWDALPHVLPWRERMAHAFEKWQNRTNAFLWSTVGSLWDALPPTLRPAIVERHLPHYRWCISSGSDEIFLSGTAHSVEKATDDARTVTAILKGVFEVIRRRSTSVAPPAFTHVVYFENGTKVIPEVNPPSGYDGYSWKPVGTTARVVHVESS